MSVVKRNEVGMDDLGFCLCLVCCEKIKCNLQDDELVSEKLQSLYWIFLGHLKVTNDMSDFDFLVEPFPFCKLCTTLLIDLSKVHRKSTSSTCRYNFKKKKIDKIIAQLSCKIIKSYHSNIFVEPLNYFQSESNHQVSNSFDLSGVDIKKEPENDRLLDLLSSTRKKVHIVRKSIYDAFNVSVSVDRISEESDQTKQQLTIHTYDGLNSMNRYLKTYRSTPSVSVRTDETCNNLKSTSHFEDYQTVAPVKFEELKEITTITDSPEGISDDDFNSLFSSSDKDDNEQEEESSSDSELDSAEPVQNAQSQTKAKSKSVNDVDGSSPKKKGKKKTIDRSRGAVKEVSPTKFVYRDLYYFEFKEDGTWKCSTCNFASAQKNPVVRHICRVHHKEENLWRCTYAECTKQYKYQYLLRRHQRSHTGEKPFKCPHESCDKTFQLHCSMLRHSRVHASVKPFLCPICGSSFVRNIHLQQHINTIHDPNRPKFAPRKRPFHPSIKPFLCDLCGSGFTKRSHLKIHLRTIHDPNRPPWKKFRKSRKMGLPVKEPVPKESASVVDLVQ